MRNIHLHVIVRIRFVLPRLAFTVAERAEAPCGPKAIFTVFCPRAPGEGNGGSYSKAVQKSCAADYRKYCGEYGLESAALRVCMDKAGKSLSQSCVKALVQSGEVSQAEVDRRKRN
jgi:hypothetical protein